MPTDGSETFESDQRANIRPLEAGDQAPAFALPDPDDIVVSSAALLKDGPLIVTFYRGIWCPYCREDLKDLASAVPQIRACGASLVAIAHQTAPGSNGKFRREHGLEFPILDDRRRDVADAAEAAYRDLQAAQASLVQRRRWRLWVN